MTTVVRSGCMLAKDGSSSQVHCARLVMAVFAITGIIYIVACVGVIIFIKVSEEKKEVKPVFITCAQAVAGLLYYCGDNLDPLSSDFGDLIGCHETCQERTQSASFGLLFGAGMLYLLLLSGKIPKQYKKMIVTTDTGNSGSTDESLLPENTKSYKNLLTRYKFCEQLLPIAQLIRILPKLDVVYTSITLATRISESSCETLPKSFKIAVWACWVLIPVLLAIAILVVLIHYWYSKKNWSESESKPWKCCVGICQVITALTVIFMITIYLLADNEYPLNCATDNKTTQGIIRLTFMLVSVIIIGVICLLLVIYACKKKKYKLDC